MQSTRYVFSVSCLHLKNKTFESLPLQEVVKFNAAIIRILLPRVCSPVVFRIFTFAPRIGVDAVALDLGHLIVLCVVKLVHQRIGMDVSWFSFSHI